jgi:uncharacterized membrane protein YqaE (UPF0057 family)
MRKLYWSIAVIFMLAAPFQTVHSSVLPVETPREWDPALVRSAFDALKNMPRKERHGKLKEARAVLKDYKKAKRAGEAPDTNTLILVLIDILLPPVAVYLHEGETNTKFWITLLLFVLGLAGALAFSWLLIFASIVYGLIVILGA